MRKGWGIAFAGMGLNLTIGIIYSWSIFNKILSAPIIPEKTGDMPGFGWLDSMAGWPFTLCIIIWAILMIPGGRLQDKFGPRKVATAGAILLGVGLFIASFSSPAPVGVDLQKISMWEQMKLALPALVGVGVFAGSGMGLAYASATPATVKWFPPTMKGRATGVVVAGMGLASVYIAPLANHLITSYGVSSSFKLLAVGFAAVGCLLAQFLKNPPAGYVPEPDPRAKTNAPATAANSGKDYHWTHAIKTPIFYLIWFQFVFSTSAGLMIIGKVAKIIPLQSGKEIQAGFLFVALLSIFNATGRVCSGFISDRLGANKTLLIACAIQAVNMLVFSQMSTLIGFIAVTAVTGFCYGSCMPLFPTITAGFWGTKNLGMNYGVLYTAWGVAGAVCPMLSGRIFDTTGSYELAYYIAAALLAIVICLCAVRGKYGEAMSHPVGSKKY